MYVPEENKGFCASLILNHDQSTEYSAILWLHKEENNTILEIHTLCIPANVFRDKDYVSCLTARGIINGTGDGKFSPDSSITRAEFVTILARLSGDDLSGYTASSFSDVAATDWYFAAVQWAYANGIVSGSDGMFAPGADITREQMSVMLYNYAKYAGADVSNAAGMSVREFSDYASISSWALEPIQWAINNSIVFGTSDGTFAPPANATRAQSAKMIALFLKGMIGG